MTAGFLILALCTYFDSFDHTDAEWVSDGYAASHEVLYPLELVQPLYQTGQSIGYRALFLDDQSYRIILVGSREMMVIEEDSSRIIEIPHSGCWGGPFSIDGRYTALRFKSPDEYALMAVVDVETGGFRWFHVSSSGEVFSVSDGMLRRYDFESGSYTGSIISQGIADLALPYPGSGEILHISRGFDPVLLICYDENGNQLWSNQTDYEYLSATPVFMPGERLVLTAMGEGIACFSMVDGSEMWSQGFPSAFPEASVRILNPCASASGEFWSTEISGIFMHIEETGRDAIPIGRADDSSVTVSILETGMEMWKPAWPLSMGNSGSVLLKFWTTHMHGVHNGYRYALVDVDGQPVWASELQYAEGTNINLVDRSLDITVPVRALLSPDESRIIYVDENRAEVHIVYLTRIPWLSRIQQ